MRTKHWMTSSGGARGSPSEARYKKRRNLLTAESLGSSDSCFCGIALLHSPGKSQVIEFF